MKTNANKHLNVSSTIRLYVTEQQRETLIREAAQYGYELPSFLRLRVFGKVKGMRIIRRPSVNAMLLGDAIGKLTALIGELNKLGSHISQIAKWLTQNNRDLFGLDSVLRLFEQTNEKILNVLLQIEAAISGRLKNHKTEEKP